MIAQALIILFPLLAAVPLAACLLLLRLPGQALQPAWRIVLAAAIPFALWQWLLNDFTFATPYWLYLVRMVDPFLLSGMMAGVLRAENGNEEEADDRHRLFLQRSLPWLVLNAAVQGFSLAWAWVSPYASIVSVLFVGYRIIIEYGLHTIRPRIRQRISVAAWMVSVLIPLPVARLVFLGHMAGIWLVRVLGQLRTMQEEKRMLDNEKQIISRISETLTVVIQDVGNFQESMLNYLKGMCESLEVKSGAVYLWDSEHKVFRVSQVHGLFFPLTHSVEHTIMREKALHELVRSTSINSEDNLVWQCGHGRKPIHIPYASQDPRIQKLGIRGNSIQSLVLAPLLLEHELLGVLVLQNKHYERYFTESDAYLVYTFAHYATLMVNASRMLQDRAERERVQQELSMGRKIQYDLLPRRIPVSKGIELAGSMVPANEIGGDYYDFFEVSPTRLGIAIGDVSGKGVPAGMLMTILQTLLHSQYRHYTNTRELLVAVNHAVSQKIKSSMFITFLLFEWNADEQSLKYTSCGHECILHFRKAEGVLECFRSGGIALGMTDDVSGILRERSLPVAVGDTVVVYTDGVVEARNPVNEMFGLDRLKAFVEKHEGMPAEEVRAALMRTLDDYRRGAEQADDITCIVMRF